MPRVESTICTLAALLTACALDNPCPSGTVRGAGKCVPADSDAGGVDTSDDPSESDADGGTEGRLQPDIDAAEPEPPDAVEDDDAGTVADATNPAHDGPAMECPREVLSTWRSFQMSERAVPAILTCFQEDPLCGPGGACDLSSCLMSAAEVDGCDRCVAAEVACAAKHCSVPCSILTTDDACRACACAHGCLDAPAGCGVGDPHACADCSGASCSARIASTTDVITVPIFFHLLHDRVDPARDIPGYATSAGATETIVDIDARLTEANQLLDAARSDGRRLQLIRAGVVYVAPPAPAACPDPVVWTDARRVYGALNVLLTGDGPACAAAATTAFAARASGATLLRIVGNMLGIPPAEQPGEEGWVISSEQLVRMHDYARWRLGAADAVPEPERQTGAGFLHGPADPIWDKLTTRDWALNNASVLEARSVSAFSSLPANAEFTFAASRASRRVLGVRVSASFSGSPSEDLQIVISGQKLPAMPITRRAIWVGDGKLVAEEAFDPASGPLWNTLRNQAAGRTWRVSVTDDAQFTLYDIQLEIIVGDRSFGSYDRHGRGAADIMMYRPSSAELMSATNPANRTTAFGAEVRDVVPPLPQADAKVIAGDVDGDGHVDLLARRAASIWVAFDRHGFKAWRPGAIAGSALPNTSDDVLLGDFDGDGFGDLMRRRPDLARGHSVWAYHRGVGDGTFEAARAPDIAGAPFPADIHVTVADMTRRGRSDMLVRQPGYNTMIISYNDTPRPTTSGATPVFYGGWEPTLGGVFNAVPSSDRFIVLDANQDGSEDIVARRAGSGEWFVYLNQGTESFTAAQPLTIGGSRTAFNDDDTLIGSTP